MYTRSETCVINHVAFSEKCGLLKNITTNKTKKKSGSLFSGSFYLQNIVDIIKMEINGVFFNASAKF